MSYQKRRWEWVGKGKHSVFIGFWFFSQPLGELGRSGSYFWEVQGISNTPKIISPLEKFHEIVFNLALSCSGFPNLSYFPLFRNISPIFLSCASKELSKVSIRIYRFGSFFSSMWASWVVLTAVFWEAQGISNTPRLISPLEKSHKIVFNLSVSCSGFPNLSYFPLFRYISPIFLSFASKERW